MDSHLITRVISIAGSIPEPDRMNRERGRSRADTVENGAIEIGFWRVGSSFLKLGLKLGQVGSSFLKF